MAEDRHVLVVGGGNVEQSGDGWATKTPIADYLHDLADEFGHCVWIVQRSGTWHTDLPSGDPQIAGQIDPSRVQVIPVNYNSIRNAPRCWLILLREALRRPYAMLYLPAILTLVPVIPVVKLLCKRTVVYLAGDYEISARDLASERWLGWSTLFRKGYEISMFVSDVTIARGRHLANMARRHNRKVIETIPLGHMNFDGLVQPRELHPESDRRILFLGLLLWSKGIRELLEAVKRLADRHPESPLALDVLGQGPDRAETMDLCRELGIEQQVHFRGWIEEEQELEGFFQRADLVVMPTSTHAEGVPRVIDEALIRGIPVVATRIAGVPDDFCNGEVRLVACADAEDLANGMDEVLFDQKIRQRYIEGALRRRTHWMQWGTAAKQHARVLRGEIEL